MRRRRNGLCTKPSAKTPSIGTFRCRYAFLRSHRIGIRLLYKNLKLLELYSILGVFD